MNHPASAIPPLPIHDRLRAIRFFAGLNQSELSKLLECSQGTISKLENGELEPTAFHLIRLRQVFGVSIDAIIDGLIPYRVIAERFVNSGLLPSRYLRGAATKLKFLYPLVRAFEIRFGTERLFDELARVGVKSAVLAEPELLVSPVFFQDLIEIYREAGTVATKEFLADVQNSASVIQSNLPSTSRQTDEWLLTEKWNLFSATDGDLAWGARPYANAVVQGLRTGMAETQPVTGRRIRA